MTETVNFEGANVHMGPPPGLEEMVGWLHVFTNGNANVSAWKPSPELLARLNAGESIFVSVMSGSRNVETPQGWKVVPIVFPMYVGSEAECKAVVSDTGATW